MPHATVEIEVEPGPATDDGVDQVTYLLAAEPGGASPAPGPGRVRRRALPCDAGGASGALGGTADAGVRRGRRRDRRRGRGLRSAVCCRRSARGTRCCASRTSRRWRRSPGRRSWWRRPWNGEGRQGRQERTRGTRRGGRRRRARRRAVADARRGRRLVPRPPPRSRAAGDCGRRRSGPAPCGRGCSVMARRRLRKVRRAEVASGPGHGRPAHQGHDPAARSRATIAVINHVDLDRVAADGLIEAGVVAVVNASPSISGRYPNGGPIRIVQAGIPLIDDVGADVHGRGARGRRRPHRATASSGATTSCSRRGHGARPRPSIEAAMEAARADDRRASSSASPRTRSSTSSRRRGSRSSRSTLPPLHTKFAGRHALVVVRGHDYRSDLAALRPYIREYRPVLIGVDGGADALLEFGFKPDIIIGDFDSVSAKGLRCGAELVHHVHPDGRAPGPREPAWSGASSTTSSWPRARARTSRCCSPTSRGAAHRRGRHPRHDGRVPRQGPPRAWRRRSSPGCGSARCSSTPRA